MEFLTNNQFIICSKIAIIRPITILSKKAINIGIWLLKNFTIKCKTQTLIIIPILLSIDIKQIILSHYLENFIYEDLFLEFIVYIMIIALMQPLIKQDCRDCSYNSPPYDISLNYYRHPQNNNKQGKILRQKPFQEINSSERLLKVGKRGKESSKANLYLNAMKQYHSGFLDRKYLKRKESLIEIMNTQTLLPQIQDKNYVEILLRLRKESQKRENCKIDPSDQQLKTEKEQQLNQQAQNYQEKKEHIYINEIVEENTDNMNNQSIQSQQDNQQPLFISISPEKFEDVSNKQANSDENLQDSRNSLQKDLYQQLINEKQQILRDSSLKINKTQNQIDNHFWNKIEQKWNHSIQSNKKQESYKLEPQKQRSQKQRSQKQISWKQISLGQANIEQKEQIYQQNNCNNSYSCQQQQQLLDTVDIFQNGIGLPKFPNRNEVQNFQHEPQIYQRDIKQVQTKTSKQNLKKRIKLIDQMLKNAYRKHKKRQKKTKNY